jgi:intergrase/recombinase
MNKEDLRHKAIETLIDIISGFSVVEAELTAENINPVKLSEALDLYIAEINEARKTFEGLVE